MRGPFQTNRGGGMTTSSHNGLMIGMYGWMGWSSDAVYDDHDGIVSSRGVCRLHWTDEGTDAWNWYCFRVTYYLHFSSFRFVVVFFFHSSNYPINSLLLLLHKYVGCVLLEISQLQSTDWLTICVCVSLGFIIFPCTFLCCS